MNIGSDGVVTDTTKQGGLAAAYYFGGMFGCFVGGWVGDKLGRKKGTFIGAVTAILGAALMCGSINSNMVSPSLVGMDRITADLAISSSFVLV